MSVHVMHRIPAGGGGRASEEIFSIGWFQRVGIAYLYIGMYKAKKLRAPCKYTMGLGLHYRTVETTNYVHILRVSLGQKSILEFQEKRELNWFV